MDIFILTLKQLMMMATLIMVGFVLRKKGVVPENTGVALSKIETFVFVPALSFINQLNNCTIDNFAKNSSLMLYGLVFVVIAIAVSYPLSGLFVRNSKSNTELDYQRSVYKYALTFGNYGFIGNFVVLGIWGDTMLYKYLMLTFFVAIVCSSWGLYILIPKGHSSLVQNLKKGLTAPPILALVFGMICGLLGLKKYFPDFVLNALDTASSCMGPVAMILAGIVIGGYDIKGLLVNKKVYSVTFLRLIIIPAIFMIILNLLGTNKEIMTLILIAFATPLGMNTIVYPAAYGGDTKTGAAMTMISSTFSVVTIPIMYYIFIVLL